MRTIALLTVSETTCPLGIKNALIGVVLRTLMVTQPISLDLAVVSRSARVLSLLESIKMPYFESK